MATASSLKNQLVKREVVGQAPAIANSVKARVVYLMMCASGGYVMKEQMYMIRLAEIHIF